MSRHVKCPACQSGDHDRHVRDWHVMADVLGGEVCPCTGDCAEMLRADDAARDLLWQIFADPEADR